ncbi:hypothetical protein D3C81_1795070 [compost metagenome]
MLDIQGYPGAGRFQVPGVLQPFVKQRVVLGQADQGRCKRSQALGQQRRNPPVLPLFGARAIVLVEPLQGLAFQQVILGVARMRRAGRRAVGNRVEQ